MANLEENFKAGTRFVSGEMQDIFERVTFLIPNWKWIALLVGIVIVYFARFFIVAVFRKLKTHSYFADRSFMQFFLKLDIERSLSWGAASLIGMAIVEALDLPDNMNRYLHLFLKLILAWNIIRLCYLAVDAFGSKIQEWAKTTESQIDDQLAPLATKTMKVLVILVGSLLVLQNFGVNVTALLAGLGIGGVALAFAAQDTVANVFGTITILLDTPFKLGDKVKIGDTEGFIEEVGFRSTRIRTYYNSLVSLPNSVVAKEKIDNMTERNGWVRFRTIVGVTYDASMGQINQFSKLLADRLKQDASVDKSRISITFNGFGDSSLNILVNFHFKIKDGEDELARNQDYLELTSDMVHAAKMEFAFPTRTMIIQNPALNPSMPGQPQLPPPV